MRYTVVVLTSVRSHSLPYAGKCLFCRQQVTSTGASRLVDHLAMKCSFAPMEVKQGFSEVLQTREKKTATKQEGIRVNEQESENTKRQCIAHVQELKQVTLEQSTGIASTIIADQAIANFFYASGISFAAASSHHNSYYQEMVRAIKAAPIGYVPPNRKKLAGPLLDECHTQMLRMFQQRDPEGTASEKYGCAYISDGWDSVDHLPLVNSSFVCANDGGRYWRSVDTSGNAKTAEYLASLMIADIYDFGCTKVVSVLSDTCNTMKKAWRYVQAEFPWISIVPCQAHVIPLLMKDIANLEPVKKVIGVES